MMPWRPVFFAVNVSSAVAFVGLCVVSVAEVLAGAGSGFAFLGGVCLSGPAVMFAICEWLLYVRGARSLERPLGVVCGVVGGIAIVSFVGNLGEAVAESALAGVPFWLMFGGLCSGVGGYGFWCGWLRIRRMTFPDERGFPVSRREVR